LRGRKVVERPQGIVFLVSAVMLRDLAKYDKALTAFSGKIGPFVEYRMDEAERMTVLNETKYLYQYFDATPQAEYLYACVAETIEKDLREEIGFIQRYDRALGETFVKLAEETALLAAARSARCLCSCSIK
jgi:hypothetical protein